MVGLEERLKVLEGTLSGRLLAENYEGLTEETGQLCQDLLVEYISLAETVSDKDIGFIKNLTKVASHVMKLGEGSLDNFLERIYQFNIEGVKKVRVGIEGHNQDNLLRLESHLLAYAGDAAQALYEKTRDIEWAEKWYETYKLSADMTIDSEPKHSAHSYSFAADAAKALFEKTGEIEWAKKWYEGDILSADMTKESEPRHSAYTFSFAGDAAQAVFGIIKDRNNIPMKEKIGWAEKWYEGYKLSADMSKDSEPIHSAHAYSFAGNAAQALFEKTGNLGWGKEWYECEILSADMTRESEPSHSAHAYGFAGNAAKALFEKTEQIEWGEKAIKGYGQFTTYYDENPDSQKSSLIRSIKYQIHELESKIELSKEAARIAKLF